MEYKPRYRVTLDLTLTKSHKYDIGFLHKLIETKLANGVEVDGIGIVGYCVVDIASLNGLKADVAARTNFGAQQGPDNKEKK